MVKAHRIDKSDASLLVSTVRPLPVASRSLALSEPGHISVRKSVGGLFPLTSFCLVIRIG